MSQTPCVEWTAASAMASPRPVPPTSSLPRWNRSKTASRCSSGMPGPESSTRSSTRPPVLRTLTTTWPPAPANFARVVDQCAGQAVEQLWRRLDQGRPGVPAPHLELHRDGRRHRREPLRAGPGHLPDVGDFGFTHRRRWFVGTGQPEKVFDDAAEAPPLGTDPLQHDPIVLRRAWTIERELDLGFYDRDWRAQLVGRVGGELRLSPPDKLRWCRRTEADDGGTREDGRCQDHAEHELGEVERRPNVRRTRQALTGHQHGGTVPLRGEAERGRADPEGHRDRVPGPGREGRRVGGQRRHPTRWRDRPHEGGRVVEVGVRRRASRLMQRQGVLAGVLQAVGQPAVRRGQHLVGHHQVEHEDGEDVDRHHDHRGDHRHPHGVPTMGPAVGHGATSR